MAPEVKIKYYIKNIMGHIKIEKILPKILMPVGCTDTSHASTIAGIII
jgi:hypothetical protein